MQRQISLQDKAIGIFDVALRTLCVPEQREARRMNPADTIADVALTTKQKRHVAGLMRVNHAGEVCAQALYQGQALVASLEHVKEQMENSAIEEIDHLAWCEDRLRELNASPGVLNPLWYCGAWWIGIVAGLIGDKWSLGFVVETEKQVTNHLQKHLKQIPKQDAKTFAILKQMQVDEMGHADIAEKAGAAKLPFIIRKLMRFSAKLMTTINYYY